MEVVIEVADWVVIAGGGEGRGRKRWVVMEWVMEVKLEGEEEGEGVRL